MADHGACDAGGRFLIPPRLTLAPLPKGWGAFSCPPPSGTPARDRPIPSPRLRAPPLAGTRPAPRPARHTGTRARPRRHPETDFGITPLGILVVQYC